MGSSRSWCGMWVLMLMLMLQVKSWGGNAAPDQNVLTQRASVGKRVCFYFGEV
jgi:hypothetical protein